METETEKPVWGVKAIAALFNVKENTVWNWVRHGVAPEMEVIRTTGPRSRWYAFPSEVAAFLRR